MEVPVNGIAPLGDRAGGSGGRGTWGGRRKKGSENAPAGEAPDTGKPRRGEPGPDSGGRPVGVKVDIRA